MLLQVVIGACLETPEYFSIGSPNMSIALWMCNGRMVDMDAEVLTIFLKHYAGKIGPIVSDDSVWEPEPTDD
jgi:hypothetical protein